MADLQGKNSLRSRKSKYGAIFDLAKILHLDWLECGESIKMVPMADFQGKSFTRSKESKKGAILDLAKILYLD